MTLRFKLERLPEEGEIVLCTVKKLGSSAAFCTLDEYKDLEGMVHISEIASRWSRNIKDLLKVGQKVFCVVLSVDPVRKYIDLSIKRVRDADKRRKRDELKKEKKAEKLVELLCQEIGEDPDRFYEKYLKKFKEENRYLFYLFEEAAEYGEKALKGLDIPEDIKKRIVELAKKYFARSTVEIKRTLSIYSIERDGLKRIQNLLLNFLDEIKGEVKSLEATYIGGGKYLIRVETDDPKRIEKLLNEKLEELSEKAEKMGVYVEEVGEKA